MVLFGCDWCNKIQQPGETWILGLAAEAVGVSAARREVNILTAWDETHACDRLAVHFCSPHHKDRYMAALFNAEPLSAQTVVETTRTTIRPKQPNRVRAAGSSGSNARKKKVAPKKRRRAA